MSHEQVPDEVEIVGIAETDKPPFTRPPEPATIFRLRAERFATLAPDHPLEPYLRFLGELSRIQDAIARRLPAPDLPSMHEMRFRAANGMPVLPREELRDDPSAERALDLFLEAADAVPMPDEAGTALDNVRLASAEVRREMFAAVLSDAVPVSSAAEHIFAAAALQVAAAHRAALVPADLPQPVADGVCPCCGAPPVTSAVVGWAAAGGSRYVQCSLCATRWNHVRVKCVACGNVEGIAYEAIEGVADTIRAETCDACRSYLKILHQHKDAALDPVADDVASLGLDLLVREAGWGRAGVNPYLLGY